MFQAFEYPPEIEIVSSPRLTVPPTNNPNASFSSIRNSNQISDAYSCKVLLDKIGVESEVWIEKMNKLCMEILDLSN